MPMPPTIPNVTSINAGECAYDDATRPMPSTIPPSAAMRRGPTLSCSRPAKIIVMAKAPVATVKGKAASALLQCHCTTSALAITPQA